MIGDTAKSQCVEEWRGDQCEVARKYEIAGEVKYLRFFFFNDTATTEIYTLSLHDALPIYLKDALCGFRD